MSTSPFGVSMCGFDRFNQTKHYIMILFFLFITLFAIGVVQSIGLICRTLTIDDHSVPYARALNQYWMLYISFFIVLGGLIKLSPYDGVFSEPSMGFICIAAPLMATRYYYITRYLPRKHPEYI